MADKNQVNDRPKVEFSMLLIWTVIFVLGSFWMNPLVFRDQTPPLAVLAYAVIGFLFFMGFSVSWVQWLVWWIKRLKNKKPEPSWKEESKKIGDKILRLMNSPEGKKFRREQAKDPDPR